MQNQCRKPISKVKALFKSAKASAYSYAHLVQFPDGPDGLPRDAYQHAYRGEEFPSPPVCMPELASIARGIPKRVTHAVLRDSAVQPAKVRRTGAAPAPLQGGQGGDALVQMLGQVLAQFAPQRDAGPASVPLLPLQAAPRLVIHRAGSVDALSPSGAASSGSAPLALLEAPAGVASGAPPAAAPAQAASLLAPAAQRTPAASSPPPAAAPSDLPAVALAQAASVLAPAHAGAPAASSPPPAAAAGAPPAVASAQAAPAPASSPGAAQGAEASIEEMEGVMRDALAARAAGKPKGKGRGGRGRGRGRGAVAQAAAAGEPPADGAAAPPAAEAPAPAAGDAAAPPVQGKGQGKALKMDLKNRRSREWHRVFNASKRTMSVEEAKAAAREAMQRIV